MSEFTAAQTHIVLLVNLVVGMLSLWGSSVIINAFFVFGKGRGFAIMVLLLAIGDWAWALASVGSAIVLLTSPERYPGFCWYVQSFTLAIKQDKSLFV
jgi:hypothetical protein